MIRELHLQNFKCFEDQKFRLRPLTLLTGLNGTGKSSVLQSLLLLRQSYQRGLLQTYALALNGDLVSIGTGLDALFEGAKLFEGSEREEIRIEIFAEETELTAGWRFDYAKDADTLQVKDGSPPEGHPIYSIDLFTEFFQYLQAERVGPRRFFDISNIVGYHANMLGSKGEYTASFLATSVRTGLLQSVESWLGLISPGVRINLTSVRNMDIVGLEYAFAVGNQVTSNNYRSTNVGFGITYALPIIVSALESKPGTLLLIENPEAHLHPRGQAAMGRLLALAASSGIQVLVETHSDHVLNGIRVAVHDGELKPEDVQIHFFQKREEDGRSEVISPQIDRDGRLDQWPEGFFDEFDKSLDVLLQPRKE